MNLAERTFGKIKVGAGPDVFISYAREDRSFAERLSRALVDRGLQVWWDHHILGGQDFRSTIADAIRASDKVIVLWSKSSVASSFVLDEARLASSANKLLPVLIDGSSPPLGFGHLHCLRFADEGVGLDAVIAAVRNRASPEPPTAGPSRRRVLASFGAVGMAAGIVGTGWWLSDGLVRPAAAGNRVALVIGSSAYQDAPHLPNCINDAEAITAALRARGFRVHLLIDAGRAELIEGINRFKTLLSLGGTGLFYHAGHAFWTRNSDYIIPVDAHTSGATTEEELIQQSIDISEVRSPIEQFFAAWRVPVQYASLDLVPAAGLELPELLPESNSVPSQEAGPRAQGNDILERSSSEQMALPELPNEEFGSVPSNDVGVIAQDKGVVMIYAADEGGLAMDAVGGQHSPFAEAILEEIGVGDGEILAFAKRVRVSVHSRTEGLQRPVLEDESRVDFAFNRPDRDPTGILRIVLMDSCRANPYPSQSPLAGPIDR